MKQGVYVGLIVVGIVIMAQAAAAQISKPVAAQTSSWLSEITVFGGKTIGKEDLTPVGVAFAFNLSSRLGAEAEVSVLLHNGDVETRNFNLNGMLNLGSGMSLTVPYLTGGAGIFDGEMNILDEKGTYVTINAGGGFKFFVEPILALRLDARVFLLSDSGDLKHVERISGGFDFVF